MGKNTLEEREQLLVEKESVLKEKEAKLQEKEKELQEKELLLRQKEERLAENNDNREEQTRKLEEALEQAKRANSSKSRFLAQTSHEIRTPLNIIIGMVELAKDEISNPNKLKDYLMKIEGSSKILLGLINDILDMSAIEGGKMKLDESRYSFKEQITNLSIMYFQQAQKKDIHFDVHVKGVTEDFVVGDELRVNQIIMNIMSNAIKFTPAGGSIEMEVIQASTSRDRTHMRFVIKDTGCGMSPDMLKRLFKPFEQEDAATARKFGGSGLGMAITKNLVEMMGGSIKVNSELGKGTEFIVDVPFGRAEKGIKEKIVTAFSEYRALVVADNEESCHERGVVLEDMGLKYDMATDCDEALDMMGQAEEEGRPYRICVIDWRISNTNGIDLIKEIRDIFGDDMSIIGAAFEFSDLIEQGKQAGADYMVAKPVFRSTLFDALMHLSNGQIQQYDSKTDATEYSFDGKRVLLAEDVALNMEVAVKLLKKVGIQVTCAEDGLQAVNIFNDKPEDYFDCIFLDINMPVMDGYEAARNIRANEKKYAKTVPIYAMTANAFTEDVAEALDAGMDGHIAKPIETDVLYKTLSKLFSQE